MSSFDPRLLRLSLEIDGKLNVYDGLYISASGTKYANALQNECSVKIINMRRSARDYLLTETSPYNRPRRRKKLILEAGRQSTGYFKLFEGDVIESSPSQPPDIELNLKAKTGGWFKLQPMAQGFGSAATLDTIARTAADSMGLSLQNEATPKTIANHSYTGSTLRQVDQINDMGYTAFIDDDTLVVTDRGKGLSSAPAVLSKLNGMIGIPEPTEQGVKVKYLLDPRARVGGRITIRSDLNPAVNGEYIIFKLSFEVANRDTPFYTIAECQRVGLWPILRI